MKLWMTLLSLFAVISIYGQTVTINFADPNSSDYQEAYRLDSINAPRVYAMACIDPTSGAQLNPNRHDDNPAVPSTYDNNNCFLGKPGIWAMWAGDANGDGKVVYDGPGTDLPTILSEVLLHPGNGSFAPNFPNATGYLGGDVNMDGKVIYDGTGTELPNILSIILLNPANTTFAANSQDLVEQIPSN